MGHYLWIPILCLLTCGCSKEPSPETGPGQLHSLRVAFVAEEPRTRSLSDGEERRIDDLNVWIYDTGRGYAKHLYLTGTDRLQLVLTAGEYECFVVANQGVSVGGLPYERMETLGTNTGTEAKLTEKGRLVMSARAILRTGAGTQTVSLRRVVAKVRMRIVLGTSLDPRTVIDRISLGNHPNLVALFGDNKLKPYQGTCVYPGDDGISDFNVRRNHDYVLSVTICGANPEDVRVDNFELKLDYPATNVYVGQALPLELLFTAHSFEGNSYYIEYIRQSGSCDMTMGSGKLPAAGTIAAEVSGTSLSARYALEITPRTTSPIQISFTVTDSGGEKLVRVLSLYPRQVRRTGPCTTCT